MDEETKVKLKNLTNKINTRLKEYAQTSDHVPLVVSGTASWYRGYYKDRIFRKLENSKLLGLIVSSEKRKKLAIPNSLFLTGMQS